MLGKNFHLPLAGDPAKFLLLQGVLTSDKPIFLLLLALNYLLMLGQEILEVPRDCHQSRIQGVKSYLNGLLLSRSLFDTLAGLALNIFRVHLDLSDAVLDFNVEQGHLIGL